MTLEEHKNVLRSHSRYPYTYACDWLRLQGKAETRAEAAGMYDGWTEAVVLAEKYVTYWALVNMANELLQEIS